MESGNQLANLKYIVKSLKFPSFNNGILEAQLSLNEKELDIIKEWDNIQEFIDNDIYIDSEKYCIHELDNSILGKIVNVKLIIDHFAKNGLKLFKEIEDFYTNMISCRGIGEDIPLSYIFDINSYTDEEEATSIVSTIHSYDSLFKLIKSISDYEDNRNLILLHNKKVEIDFYYISVKKLRVIELVDELLLELNKELHQEQRKIILKSILVESLLNVPFEDRINNIFNNFSHIYSNYKASFELYLEEFSYGKLKREFEEENLNLLSKISNTVDTLKSQVIVISTSIIAVSQIDTTDIYNIKNFLILIGIFFASILYTSIINNQSEILNRVKSIIDDKEELFRKSVTELYLRELEEKFDLLKEAYKKQVTRLETFKGLVWTNFVLSLAYFIILISNN